jgi:hypothetical protein
LETSIERLKCPSESFKGVKENINYELKIILNDQTKTIKALIKRSLTLENDINDLYYKLKNLSNL